MNFNKLTYLFLEKSPTGIFSKNEVISAIHGTDDSRQALLKRAIESKHIIRIRRGLYCLSTPLKKNNINPYVAAQYIYGPSYISLETALSYHNWIPEAVYSFTNVSKKKSKEFDTPIGQFSYTRVPQKVLYTGVERVVTDNKGVFFMASALKALCDYIYIHRLNWKSIQPVVSSLRVDEMNLHNLTAEDIEEQLDNYTSARIIHFLTGIKKDILK